MKIKEEIMKKVNTIRELRQELLLDMSEFAKKLKISSASLYSYENNKRMPRFSTVRKIYDFALKNNIEFDCSYYINRKV